VIDNIWAYLSVVGPFQQLVSEIETARGMIRNVYRARYDVFAVEVKRKR